MPTQSRTIALGSPAPDFVLTDASGGVWTLAAVAGDDPVLIAFICNHCPYVLHIADALAAFGRDYQKRIAVVAINANDAASQPEDAPDKMAAFASHHQFVFPYLYDETQATARAYGAVCTPDLFLFDGAKKLVYHGQFDETRPGRGAATGANLRAAAEAMLAGRAPLAEQTPSVGCSIKWKPS